jgi:hypothetical protein
MRAYFFSPVCLHRVAPATVCEALSARNATRLTTSIRAEDFESTRIATNGDLLVDGSLIVRFHRVATTVGREVVDASSAIILLIWWE